MKTNSLKFLHVCNNHPKIENIFKYHSFCEEWVLEHFQCGDNYYITVNNSN